MEQQFDYPRYAVHYTIDGISGYIIVRPGDTKDKETYRIYNDIVETVEEMIKGIAEDQVVSIEHIIKCY